MPDMRADDPLRRVAKSERIVALDVLRGIAILLILLMNIPIMGGYSLVEPFDPRIVSWTPADQATFIGVGMFFEGTQRGLLEVLFGAGVMIMTRNAMQPDGPVSVADLHYRRNLWLVAFGLIHAFVLLWPGDILFAYGITALFVFPFRRLGPTTKALVGAAFILAAISPGVMRYAERVDLKADVAAAQAKVQAGKTPSAAEKEALDTWKEKVEAAAPLASNKKKQEAVAKEKKARLGPLPGYAEALAGIWAKFNVGPFLYFGFFEIFGTMLLGMALYDWGVLQGRARTGVYVAMVVAGYGLGATARYLADMEALRFTPEPKIGWMTWDAARIALVLGHIGLVNLALRTGVGQRVLGVFQAPGRMPLTVYLTASVLCMWILFPGIGFGLFGQFGWAGLTAIALAIIAAQVVLANVWMAAFESGPVDWLWKSLAYWKRQPFRKQATGAEALAAAE
ncbi:DUF418 domain-containing protein [Phenylobacterium sp.]|uniref:DUF418 domain-containing protein n=1 Tax=Phenylobacterium sp. TaxID=1871053 RepID=UPI002ED9E77C